ncbi:tetraspanin-18-like [Babylonia areolata]|uniref:tetraspanin-18-like n=1 Tax=Babylonia areolata TaxID=304850 RepID=UPI003FD2F807
MGACVGFSQCILVVFNLVFALFGLVFLVVGCVVRFGSHLLDNILQDFYSALQKLMEKAGSSSSLSSFNLGDYLQSATLAFIVLGAFFFLLGILGCVGACCKNKFCLSVYAAIVGVIIAGEVVFVVLLFTIRDKLETALESPLYDSLRNDYVGINSSDAISLGWNFAMITFKCCGVENYTDFQNASHWQRTYNAGQGRGVNLTVPVACCRLNGTFPDVQMPEDFTCAVNPNPTISNIDKGCYDALIDFLVDNSDILIAVGATIAAVEILLFIFAICVCCADVRKKYDEVEDW